MEIVVFDVDHIRCGLDILQTQEITRIHAYTPVHGAPAYVTGLVNMRGQIITLVDVRQRFGFEPLPRDSPLWSIIVPMHDDLVGLLVDSVGDVVPVDPDATRPPPPNLHGMQSHLFSAVLETPDGLIALVERDRIAGRERDDQDRFAGRGGSVEQDRTMTREGAP